MATVADVLVQSLSDVGVRTMWGVVGDALNPVTDAIRRNDSIEWIGVRHEEAGAFAASAQAQLTGGLGVCMGTVGPGSIHLLNGLYDAKKSHAPVLAICGQVPSPEIGTEMFQEVNNDVLFSDVSVYCRTVSNAEHVPYLIEQAVHAALDYRGVAVLTLPGDVGGLEMPEGFAVPKFTVQRPVSIPSRTALNEAAEALRDAKKVTMLVGCGAREGRTQVLELAELLGAPMVLTLKAKAGFEADNSLQVGQSGLIGNPGAQLALETCDLLLLVGTDFPYRDWYPADKKVIQIDDTGAHIGRRTRVDLGLIGDAGETCGELVTSIGKHKSSKVHAKAARKVYEKWLDGQQRLAQPDYDRKKLGILRKKVDNREGRIRPEVVAAAVGEQAAPDAVFTSDTGMSTVWLSRLVSMRDEQRLVGSYNLGSMANAMPQALGAAALDRNRQVIAFCGDGGLTMLLGDLLTAVAYELPVKLVVFDNGRLGMVKLEMEQGGLPEFGTELRNPDLAAVAKSIGMHGIRVEDPDDVASAVAEALDHPGPVLLDMVTNPTEVSVPGKPSADQAWGFAIAKIKENI